MEPIKCNQIVCFANGCDGYCKLDNINKYASHLIEQNKDSPNTCSRPRELLANKKEQEKSVGISTCGYCDDSCPAARPKIN